MQNEECRMQNGKILGQVRGSGPFKSLPFAGKHPCRGGPVRPPCSFRAHT